MSIVDLIRLVVWYAGQYDIPMTTNRLVKYIYIADVFHARLNSGQTITALPWAFVSYGPYCREVMDAIDQTLSQGLIAKNTYESIFGGDKEYYIFSCRDPEVENLDSQLHPVISGKIKFLMKEIGSDTPALLDYVYFDTEPMEEPITKYQRLDFSRCRPFFSTKQTPIPKISPEKIALAKNYIARLHHKMEQGKQRLKDDEVFISQYKDNKYETMLNEMDRDDLQTGLEGIATVERNGHNTAD